MAIMFPYHNLIVLLFLKGKSDHIYWGAGQNIIGQAIPCHFEPSWTKLYSQMAWGVLSRVAKVTCDVLPGCRNGMCCFVQGCKSANGMFSTFYRLH